MIVCQSNRPAQVRTPPTGPIYLARDIMLASWSGTRGHVSSEDVVGMTVEILAGSVIAHRRPRVSMAGRDLHVAQIHARVEHGRDERRAGAYVDEPVNPDFRRAGRQRAERP